MEALGVTAMYPVCGSNPEEHDGGLAVVPDARHMKKSKMGLHCLQFAVFLSHVGGFIYNSPQKNTKQKNNCVV